MKRHDDARRLGRRAFLSRGACTLGVTLATGGLRTVTGETSTGALRKANDSATGTAIARRLPVSVEYVRGSDRLESFETLALDDAASIPELQAARVQASSLARGDAELGRVGVRVLVHGLLDARASGAADLWAFGGPDLAFPFLAWSVSAGATATPARASRVDLPTDSRGVLTLALKVGGAHPELSAIAALPRLRFASGAETGVPKLRRGLYVLGWPRPDAPRAEPARLLISFESFARDPGERDPGERDPGEEADTAAILAGAQAPEPSEEA